MLVSESRGQGIDQPHQLVFLSRFGEQSHQDGHYHANREGNNGLIEIRRHVAGVFNHMIVIESVMRGGGENPAKQSPEAGMSTGALPEHSQKKRAEQRGVKEREKKLDIVH